MTDKSIISHKANQKEQGESGALMALGAPKILRRLHHQHPLNPPSIGSVACGSSMHRLMPNLEPIYGCQKEQNSRCTDLNSSTHDQYD
jgi:hypothetical protein